ncbi:MAG: baseplate J/gp47 family protein [Butyrivibrio sp.]|nr:baseplate J/gp47 family protein [Butyrivibrio sp.]
MTNAFKPQSAEDIENRIEELRKTYTPEWIFDRFNPDAGSVIAQIFARQTEENNRLMSQMPERYHMEFVNMLDSTLRPAQPAASIVVFNMEGGAYMGTQVPKGTRLSAESDLTDSGYIVYETERNVFVTDSRIRNVFLTDAEDGTLSPVFGDIDVPEIVTGEMPAASDDEEPEGSVFIPEEEPDDSRPAVVPPFTLFGEKTNLGKSILVMYEQRLFDGVNEPIYIRFENANDTVEAIAGGRLSFRYLTKKGFADFEKVTLAEDKKTFILIKSKESAKVTIAERKYAVVTLEANYVMTNSFDVSALSLSAGGNSKVPEYAGDGSVEYDVRKFDPFSDTLAVYNECYIGHNSCFSKAGAKITLDFKVNYHENQLRITPEQEEAELAIIKRKPKKTPLDFPATATVNEISIEYYNGIGWKKIICDTEYGALFENAELGDYRLSFTCPYDWLESESGPYSGRCLRFRIIKSDNCYMRPAVHTYPTIENMRISYSYEGKFSFPDRLERICGTKKEDITSAMYLDKPFNILSGNDYHEDALYIGLDKKLTEGPVSIYFQLSDSNNQSGVKCKLEYSSPQGFSETRFTDLTEDFTRSGMLMFMPPQDLIETTIEGRRLYWLRLTRSRFAKSELSDAFLPHIALMCLNAVSVTNVQTSDEGDYYIEDAIPNTSVSLGVDNILDAEIWVNERGYTRKEEMKELMLLHPERVRAEYDFLGRISAFYVLWQEVDSFDVVPHRRCYRLDRMTGRILFSDGSKCDMPRVTDDIAFKARIRSTDGEKGNLSEGEISNFIGSTPYIESVFNPIRAHGGSNLETIDHALMRCAGIMHSRWKLVSEMDYVRHVMEFSDSIDRTRIISGLTIEGNEVASDISIVLLMKDYADGAFSFHRIAAALQRDILKHCEVTVTQDNLHIVEPIFVEISICVWAMVMDMDDSFEVQNEVKTVLSDYLNPVRSKNDDGWEIGTLPKESQILMRLGILRSKAVIQRITMIGKYIDVYGEHELDTTDIKISPFMVPKNGKHTVIITNK